jgi:outer membrane autotransporter protein
LVFVSENGAFEYATDTLANTPAGPAALVMDANVNIGALFTLGTLDDLDDAATQSLPLLVGGSQAAANGSVTGIKRVIGSRQKANAGMSSGDPFFSNGALWMKPFRTWAEQDDRGGVSGYGALSSGLVFGSEASVSNASTLGLSFAYASTSVTGNSTVAPNTAHVRAYQLTGYGSYAPNAATLLNYQLGVGELKTLGQRDIQLAGVTAESSYKSSVITASVDASRTFHKNEKTSFTPSISVAYTWMRDDAYTETGAGALNLNVDQRSYAEMIIGFDGRVDHKLNTNSRLTGNLGFGYDAMQTQDSITASFAGAPGAAFTTIGLDPSPLIARGGIGMISSMANGLELNVNYDIELRNDFLNKTASVNVRWAF